MNKEKFVACKKDSQGRMTHFKTQSGKVYDYEMAKDLVGMGNVANAELFVGRDGDTHIRGKVDGKKSNNLTNLPNF